MKLYKATTEHENTIGTVYTDTYVVAQDFAEVEKQVSNAKKIELIADEVILPIQKINLSKMKEKC